MSLRTRIQRLAVVSAAGVLLASGPLVAAAAQASGYPTFAACDQAGRAGVTEGHWPYYTCTPYQGWWHLNPA